MTKIVNGNTLIFKVNNKGEFENLELTKDVKNFIADLSEVNKEIISLIKNNLIKFGHSIYSTKGSFVVVSTFEFDENLNIVPTMQEAFDFIDMEEIERQLEL
ncbi:MAG: hypothetical protein HN427_02380 [Flavobacteriales bacterium]|jgi:hypothetical protein|nr:hypothetical protein [Flavobacteriales bacterium]MBT6013506.1 hypothetical protein [Flavobacteriales bacterium]